MGIFGFFKRKQEAGAQQKSVFIERRFLPRWRISTEARVKYDEQKEYINCQIVNLNMRGFSLITSQKLPRDCRHLTIYFSEKYIFNVEIQILWREESENKNSYGAKFTLIRDLDKEKMYRMMRENFPNQIGKY